MLRQGSKKWVSSKFLFAAASSSLYVAFSIHILNFLGDNFALSEVYSHSTSTLPAIFKLAATWAGPGGSILLWLFFQLTIAVIFRYFIAKHILNSFKTLFAYNLLTSTLGFVAISTGAFHFTSSNPSAGLGLNPVLLSSWMLIHPPITLLAYALSLSAAIVTLLSDVKNFERIFFGFAWIAKTAALVIGGVWAYEVLGWGGYWNWDVVETSSLLPWLSITLFFHSTSRNGRKFTAALTGFFIMFTSFVTRSGILQSVHAYAFSPLGFVFLFAGGLFFVEYFRSRRSESSRQNYVPRDIYGFSLKVSQGSIFIIILTCLLGILTSILSQLVGNSVTPSANYYNTAIYPFVIIFLIVLIGCSIPRLLNRKRFGGMILTSLGTGLFLVFLEYPVKNVLVNLSLPLVLVVLGSVSLGLVINMRRRKLKVLGRRLVHMAIPILLIGVFFSSTATSSQGAPTSPILLGASRSINGVEVSFVDYAISQPAGVVYVEDEVVPEYASVNIKLIVKTEQSLTAIDNEVKLYRLYGFRFEPVIVRVGLTYDAYIKVGINRELYEILTSQMFEDGEIPFLDEITVSVDRKPLIGLIWLGSAILITGEIIQLMSASMNQASHRRYNTPVHEKVLYNSNEDINKKG